ncbi:MAG: tetratricopeptide repeat protein [Elusimicrobia bacterium]|nr:tetratricopeptide repeat protein [Elusimicrobiota bacterium]
MDPSSYRRRLADGLFLTALAAYGAYSFSLLPAAFMDLCYLTSLKTGVWYMQELVHPLYVPTLGLVRAALEVFGYRGPLVTPVETLNILAMAWILWLLYRWTARRTGDALVAGVGSLLLGTSLCFWSECLRVTPYALATLFAVLSLRPYLDEDGRGGRRGWPAFFAAVSIGYHAASLALVPVLLALLWLDRAAAKTRRQDALVFAGVLTATVPACYAVWLAYHGFEPLASLPHIPFDTVFRGLEQHSRTSIYTSGSLHSQFATFYAKLRPQAAEFLTIAALLVLSGGWLLPGILRRHRSVFIAGFLTAASYGLFFILNNAENGLVFIVPVLLPMMLALAASAAVWTKVIFLVAALRWVVGAPVLVRDIMVVGAQDPVYLEVRFLAQALRPSDVLLMPGCPFPEMIHYRDFNVLQVGGQDRGNDACLAPQSALDEALAARLRRKLEAGGSVFLAEGAPWTGFSRGPGMTQKEHQLFYWASPSVEVRKRHAADIEAFLRRRFVFARPLVSTEGRVYRRLTLKPASRPVHPSPDGRGAPREGSPRDAGGEGAPARPEAPLKGWDAWTESHLRAVLAADPRDPGALGDLRDFHADREFRRLAETGESALAAGRPKEALAALAKASSLRPADAATLLRLAAAARQAGDPAQAAGVLSRAEKLSLDPRQRTAAASLALGMGEPRQALKLLATPTVIASRDAESHYLTAVAAQQAGDRATAAQALERMLRLPLSAEQSSRAAQLAGLLGEGSGAPPGRNDGADAGARLDIAAEASRAGDRRRALSALAGAASSTPDREQSRRMAHLYAGLGEHRAALDILARLAAGAPSEPGPQVELAAGAAAAGDRPRALQALARAVELRPDAPMRRRSAVLYQQIGELEAARSLLDALVRESPADGGYLADRGVLRAVAGDREGAVEDLKSAIEREPGLLSAYLTLGGLYVAQGRGEQARAVFERALAGPPRPGDAALRRLIEAESKKLGPAQAAPRPAHAADGPR